MNWSDTAIRRWVQWLSLIAAFAGGALAVSQAVTIKRSVGDPVVALVYDQPLYQSEWDQAIEAVQNDRKAGELPKAEKLRILNRLIDERLLYEHALSLQLPERDPQVRAALIQSSLVHLAQGGAENEEPSDAELRALYEQDKVLSERPFEDVKGLIRSYYQRTRAEERVRTFLARERQRGAVHIL